MLLAAYNLVRFDHVSQLLNFRVLVPTKCRCCCAQVNDAQFNLLAVEPDESATGESPVSPRLTSPNMNLHMLSDPIKISMSAWESDKQSSAN